MSTIKRIFKRENILVLSLIVVALLGIFGVPQIFGLTTDQILLLLLGVLALDMLVERLGYLDRIENKLAELSSKLHPRIILESVLRTREEMESFEECLKGAEKVWVASRTLHSFLRHYAIPIQKAAEQGTKFKFLAVNYESQQALDVIASTRLLKPELSYLASSAQESVSLLKKIKSQVPQGAVEIQLADFVPLNMFRIVDPHKEAGEMVIENYGYKVSTGQRRHFVISKKQDNQLFAFYLEQFETMWGDAKEA